MNQVRVVAILGAPYTGKSSVSAALRDQLPGPLVTVDADGLASGWPIVNDDDLADMTARNLIDVMRNAVTWGARTIVVHARTLPDTLVTRLGEAVSDPPATWSWYELRARSETVLDRIRASGFAGRLPSSADLAQVEASPGDVPLVTSIATDGLTCQDVARVVAEQEAVNRASSGGGPTRTRHDSIVTEDVEVLRALATQALIRRGVQTPAVRRLVDRLVMADLDGSPSHGLIRVLEYCAALFDGEVDPSAQPLVARSGAGWLVDGAGAGGWLTVDSVSTLLADASDKAVVVRVTRGGHLGRLRDVVAPAVDHGRVVVGCVTYSGTGQKVAPAGGTRGALATNPLVVGFPSETGPLLIDLSTSSWSEGSVRVAATTGRALPVGVLVNPDGSWSHDPNALYVRDLSRRAALAHLGRLEGSAKGYALGVAVEILGGALGGGIVCESDRPDGLGGNSGLFVSFRPELLGRPLAEVTRDVARLEAHLATRVASDGQRTTRLPGRRARVMKTTLEVPTTVLDEIRRWARE